MKYTRIGKHWGKHKNKKFTPAKLMGIGYDRQVMF